MGIYFTIVKPSLGWRESKLRTSAVMVWPVVVSQNVLVERKVQLLPLAQGFFSDEAANATSSSEYQEAHRV